MINRRSAIKYYAFILFCLILACFSSAKSSMAQAATQVEDKEASSQEKSTEKAEAEKAEAEKAAPAGPADENLRGNPRSSVEGFLKATRSGYFDQAAQHLDLNDLPWWMETTEGPELARQFKITMDRSNFWIDLNVISTDPEGNNKDGLPSGRDSIGRIKTPDKTVDIFLQRVPREDGVYIWKFSNLTVAEIPLLYQHFGYKRFEERLEKIFPDFTFLGWESWQWAEFIFFIGLTYLVAYLSTQLLILPLRNKEADRSRQIARYVKGPVRVVFWLVLLLIGVHMIGSSRSMQKALQSGTLFIIAFLWAAIRFIDIAFEWWTERMRKGDQEEAAVLMRPVKKLAKTVIIVIAALIWLDNIGFNINTLIAGLGVGGIAVALAAQDTLKNFIASVMILLDKPYRIGQRIVVKGHDGVVEEIGLRSTRMRLLTGHQTTIPNDQMATMDIENIGRRPHIRRLANITICYDTPLEKIEKAVAIILKILENHDGMDPEFPPRAYFNEFNADSLNLLVLYWYHPAD
jgi:MscS family membrane protein